jgi:hypothetical protein
MSDLLAVDKLYATEIVGRNYSAFKARLKALRETGAFTLLS